MKGALQHWPCVVHGSGVRRDRIAVGARAQHILLSHRMHTTCTRPVMHTITMHTTRMRTHSQTKWGCVPGTCILAPDAQRALGALAWHAQCCHRARAGRATE
jgi:hypothetical protein